MNCFKFTLSGKPSICPSMLNDSFTGYSDLGCRSLPFMTSNTFFQHLLACKVSFEKSADSLMGIPLYVSSIFWQFWLFFVFKFVVFLLLVVQGGKVYLPMPPSWPEVLHPVFLRCGRRGTITPAFS